MNPGPLRTDRQPRKKPYGPETCPIRRAIVEQTVARALADLGSNAHSAARWLVGCWVRGRRRSSVDGPLARYLSSLVVGTGYRVVYVTATTDEIRVFLTNPAEVLIFGPSDAAKWFVRLYDSGMLAKELDAALRPERSEYPNR